MRASVRRYARTVRFLAPRKNLGQGWLTGGGALADETVYHEKHFPRVTRCGNGSYCCSRDPSCCAADSGVFLDAEGRVVDSTSTASPSSTESSAADTPADESPDTSDGAVPDSTALKVGLGLGIPLAALVAGFGVWFLLRRRQRAAAPAPAEDQDGVAGTKYYHPPQSEAYANGPALSASELDGASRRAGPVELGSAPVAREG